MSFRLVLILLASMALGESNTLMASDKPRVIVTSDGEIDDECSMVRFLLYVNEWDIEGIVTSSSQYHWRGHRWAGDDWVQPYLEAYAKVYPNLIHHDARYPTPDYLRARTLLGNVKAEGDSPAFLHTIPTGLRSMESPNWGGWGGRYVRVRDNTWLDPVSEPGYRYPEGRWFTSSAWGRTRLKKGIPNDAELIAYLKPVWRWIDALQNDFAARADWCVKPYAEANHAPMAALAHARDITAAPGATVKLSAAGSSDPDVNQLSYRWWQYHEADSAETKVTISNASAQQASFVVPNEPGKQVHIILEVTDNGTPPLVAYRRIICRIQ